MVLTAPLALGYRLLREDVLEGFTPEVKDSVLVTVVMDALDALLMCIIVILIKLCRLPGFDFPRLNGPILKSAALFSMDPLRPERSKPDSFISSLGLSDRDSLYKDSKSQAFTTSFT